MSPAVVAPPEKPGGTVVLADKTSVEPVPARAPTVALGPLTAVAHVVVAVGAILVALAAAGVDLLAAKVVSQTVVGPLARAGECSCQGRGKGDLH